MPTLRPFLRLATRLASPGSSRGRLNILTYHRVLAERDPLLPEAQVDARTFDVHMAAMAEHFHVLSMPEAVERLFQGTLPARAACITFDDGYADNYTEALPILQRHGLTATFFVCTGFLHQGLMFNDIVTESVRRATGNHVDLRHLGLGVMSLANTAIRRHAAQAIIHQIKFYAPEDRDEICRQLHHQLGGGEPLPGLMMKPEHLTQLARSGMTVGGHTHTHPILTRLPLASVRADIQLNADTIAGLTGQSPTMFAYPNGTPDGDYNIHHADLLQQMGFKAAVSSAWGVAHEGCDRYQLPRYAPWGTNSQRFVIRLIKNALLGKHALRAARTASAIG
jgi:peptidoglycan/xylan/chitin deacetylase (PgdA/CDA1 family)